MDTYEQLKNGSYFCLAKRNKSLHKASMVKAIFILAMLIGAWSFVIAVVL